MEAPRERAKKVGSLRGEIVEFNKRKTGQNNICFLLTPNQEKARGLKLGR